MLVMFDYKLREYAVSIQKSPMRVHYILLILGRQLNESCMKSSNPLELQPNAVVDQQCVLCFLIDASVTLIVMLQVCHLSFEC